VTQLSSAIDVGITGCYGASYSGKVSFLVTSTSLASGTELYTAYNVNGNRLTVVNTSNGRNAQNLLLP
jgi:hypothetical protein